MAPPRVLLCGDVIGRLNQLFKRVSSVNKSSGPFDFLLCVGQFFPDSPELLQEFTEYVEGRSSIPLPTYFIGDYGVGSVKVLSAATRDSSNQGFKMDGLRICENLFWLRGSGKFTLHGLSVAYLSGRRSSTGQQYGVYSQDDVDALRALAEDSTVVDLFLTNEWPTGITNGTSTSSEIPSGIKDSLKNDDTIVELVSEIKPRYHIAGTTGFFYAREPYSNIDAVHVTRFIGLASVGNKDKQKFIHAISPTPASSMTDSEICAKPPNTTRSPYLVFEKGNGNQSEKRTINNVSDSQYWRYDDSQKRQKRGSADGERLCFKFVSTDSCPRGDKCNYSHDADAREQSLRGVCFEFLNKGKCERGPDCKFKHSFQDESSYSSRSRSGTASVSRSKDCWFCLSGPNVESHLIISIGESLYCALAKGPLVQGHALILPIEHLPNSLSLPEECDLELSRFRNSLKTYFKTEGKEVVFFEWVSKRGTHANIQAVPIPISKASVVQNIFNLAAAKLDFEFASIKGANVDTDDRKLLRAQLESHFSFFYVELPDGTVLLHAVEENKKFPVQFGREVLAGLLNQADRADWRNCKVSKEEEMQMVDTFKNKFGKFDPNQ